MYRKVFFGDNATSEIIKGVNVLADAVSATLGARGRNVIFSEGTIPTITKDGVTVARNIFLEDGLQNMGVMMAREASENTNREAGDGTTSTVVLLRAIINEGNRYIMDGLNPVLLKRGMDTALECVISELNKLAKKITTQEEKEQIATISTNNDKSLGKLISEVIEKVGTNGVVTVTNSNSLKTEVEYVKGTKLNRGYESHLFINNRRKLSAELDNPEIIITTDKITMHSQIIGLIEKLVLAGKHKMVLFADTIEGEALSFLVKNHLLGKFTCIPVKIPSFGDYQKDLIYDLAALTEATVLGEEESKNINDAETSDCGNCSTVIVDRDSTIITGGDGNIKERIDEVKTLLEEEKKDIFKLEKLKDRLGRLTGSIANIRVGGASETEQTEIRYRIEDAINSTKSAIEEGIVEGGGTALLRCYNKLRNRIPDGLSEEEERGFNIVVNSLIAPIKNIVENGGKTANTIIDKVIELDKGYNILTNEYEDMFESGIIDPLKCVKCEITNAVASASTLLTSSVAIINKEDGDSTNN